jgi:hypothetical protein
MKTLILLLILFCNLNLLSQENLVVISNPESMVLYRGYANKIQIGFNDILVKEYTFETSNCDSIINDSEKHNYIIYPGPSRMLTLTIVDLSVKGKKTIISETTYRVSNLPDPTLYLGVLENESTASLQAIKSMTRLFAKYSPELYFNAYFEVNSWNLFVKDLNISGTTYNLSKEAIFHLDRLTSGEKITIVANIKGSDNQIRKVTSVFYVQ